MDMDSNLVRKKQSNISPVAVLFLNMQTCCKKFLNTKLKTCTLELITYTKFHTNPTNSIRGVRNNKMAKLCLPQTYRKTFSDYYWNVYGLASFITTNTDGQTNKRFRFPFNVKNAKSLGKRKLIIVRQLEN